MLFSPAGGNGYGQGSNNNNNNNNNGNGGGNCGALQPDIVIRMVCHAGIVKSRPAVLQQ
jgi:hypothetical protein